VRAFRYTDMKRRKNSGCKKKGILIAFEGISGSGKSESIRMLYGHLTGKGYRTSVVEWNSNEIIRRIIKKLHGKRILTPLIYSIFQWIGFYIDYFTKFVPLLRKGYIVIADRYFYTALTRDKVNGAGTLHGKVLGRFARRPDILFFNDTRPDICYERITARGKALFHTNAAILNNRLLKNRDLYYLRKLRAEYLKLFKTQEKETGRYMVFIGDDHKKIIEYLEEYMGRRTEGNFKNIGEFGKYNKTAKGGVKVV
jgi:dTMP kinase